MKREAEKKEKKSKYGILSAKIDHAVIPNEYTSLFLPYGVPSNTSGAINTGVPMDSVICIV